MNRFVVGLALVLFGLSALAQDVSIDDIRKVRLSGDLSAALTMAETQLDAATGRDAMELHLELAKTYDRIGLHNNTRPVAEALQHIEQAAAIAEDLDASARAYIDLAFAEYFYRAEMQLRQFVLATMHANEALAAFQKLEDYHGQADAVHRLGLIRLQQRQLDEALELFEESLRLDRVAGERDLLRADYERHVGFVYMMQDDVATSLPFFERSLDFRIKAGATDASMFAAISLAAALVELDRSAEAIPHLEYASDIAADIDSDTGRARVQAIRERIPE